MAVSWTSRSETKTRCPGTSTRRLPAESSSAAPLAAACRRRNTAWMRSRSSRMLKGFTT